MVRKSLQELNDKKGLVGAEVGVWRGENALNILTTLNIKFLYLVDPYIPYQEAGNYYLKADGEAENTKKNAKKLLKAFETLKRIKWLYKTSMDAVKKIKDNSLDFVYIDGNHQYEFVSADIKEWTKKVKPGGLVAGHDANLPEVKLAVWEYAKANNYEAFIFKYKQDDNFYKTLASESIGKGMSWRELKKLVKDLGREFIIPEDWWFKKEKRN